MYLTTLSVLLMERYLISFYCRKKKTYRGFQHQYSCFIICFWQYRNGRNEAYMLVSCVRFTLPTQFIQHTAVRKSHIRLIKELINFISASCSHATVYRASGVCSGSLECKPLTACGWERIHWCIAPGVWWHSWHP